MTMPPSSDSLRPHGASRGSGRATVRSVAAAAGVSRATVSRVMNGVSTVDEALAERVRATAEALGYERDGTAQSLSLGRTGSVGVLVPDLGNPIFQAVLRGISDAAGDDGYRVLMADSRERAELEVELAGDLRRRTDALVLCSPRMPEAQLREVMARRAPAVVVNRRVDGLGASSVTVDHEKGMAAVADHLVALGHRHVVIANGPPAIHAAIARRAALLSAADGRFRVSEIAAGSRFEEGFAVAEQVLATGATALVAFNDLVAFGAMARLVELGVPVPEQLSVVGFDDVPFARYANPPLTTVAVHLDEVGRHAWARVRAAMADAEASADLLVRAELVVRRSTAVAREVPAPV